MFRATSTHYSRHGAHKQQEGISKVAARVAADAPERGGRVRVGALDAVVAAGADAARVRRGDGQRGAPEAAHFGAALAPSGVHPLPSYRSGALRTGPRTGLGACDECKKRQETTAALPPKPERVGEHRGSIFGEQSPLNGSFWRSGASCGFKGVLSSDRSPFSRAKRPASKNGVFVDTGGPTRLHGIPTWRPRRRRDPFPRGACTKGSFDSTL